MGASAGTHIATANIEHVKYFDDNYLNIKKYEGLNIYKGIIICHYNYNRRKVFMKLKETTKYKIETLTDSEVLFYKDDIWTKW